MIGTPSSYNKKIMGKVGASSTQEIFKIAKELFTYKIIIKNLLRCSVSKQDTNLKPINYYFIFLIFKY